MTFAELEQLVLRLTGNSAELNERLAGLAKVLIPAQPGVAQ